MPSSPRTPTHRRCPSSIDMSPIASYSPSRHGRPMSRDSPTTPFHTRSGSGIVGLDIFRTEHSISGNGMGNLADELAEVWDEEDEEEDADMEFQKAANGATTRDSGVDVTESAAHRTSTPKTLHKNGRVHRRQRSYSDSDYEDDSDVDSDGMPVGLAARMDAIEMLARKGLDSDGSDSDGVIQRLSDGLRNLGPQSGVEGSTNRLITAHTALSMHIAQQTRIFYTLTLSLLSPFSPAPDAEFVADIHPHLISLPESIPSPIEEALTSLTEVHSVTADVLSTLSYLSDLLHEFRQTTTTATRRLRSAKELVADLRREDEAREEGESWLTKGNWGERLEARECATICREVLDGFEEVCESWRAKLIAQAEADT